MSNPQGTSSAGHGVVPATVTKSYDALARVKVRFPWMADTDESDWIPIATPMAGPGRGVFFMPEEDDQVLVAFAYGDIDRGYVIGALWGSADKPPIDDRAKRQIRSVTGHVITLDDSDDSPQISIVDKSGKNKLVFDAKNNTVTIESGGDLTIKATGTLTLQGNNVTIEADVKVVAKGQEMALNGPTGVKINDGALEVV